MKELEFYQTEEIMSGIDILKEIGQVKTKKGEYHKFIYKDKEYPIEKVVIKRNNKGYIVILNK